MDRSRGIPSWRRQRSLFPVLQDAVYLDHATRAPLSTRVMDALARWAQEAARPHLGEPGAATREGVRADAARLLAADPAEIAFTSGAQQGLSLLLEGLDWRPGDQLVYSSARSATSARSAASAASARSATSATSAFPGAALPAAAHLAAREVEAVRLRLPSAAGPGALPPREVAARTLELVEKSLTGVRTRLLLLPAVSPHDGARLDLANIGERCRERGVLLAVDASLALGALPLEPGRLGIDFLVADAHRRLGSIEGTGLLYCHAGVASCVRSPDTGARAGRDARRFEAPGPAGAGIACLGAALALVLELGVPAIAERILELGAYLAHGLEARGYRVRSPLLGAGASGIVCFASGPRWTAPLLRARLARHAVHVGLASHPSLGESGPADLLAVSPHFYNDPLDLDQLLDALPG
ncbi:MAG: aminotransferase class V-fold PLP-dependent enzyme [Deltaproteobacteria bacterium]|nr:aminotransferase class V-fold PLP-dependent enzyme [Deltaproteobacteria bacterium]